MAWPTTATAVTWLETQGLSHDDAQSLLKAAGGRPDEVLKQRNLGQSMQWWSKFPQAMLAGDAAYCAHLPASEVIDALQKLCHDLLMLQTPATLRYFNHADLPDLNVSAGQLTAWFKRLSQAAKTAEHPFNAGLMLEALCTEAREVLNSPA
jgi:DNA polymerase-3 subunit delta'